MKKKSKITMRMSTTGKTLHFKSKGARERYKRVHLAVEHGFVPTGKKGKKGK